jgi:serine-type D-Ala-D-Ala carboxypeptidase/endopeptidase (penicillin-binding protein 4)
MNKRPISYFCIALLLPLFAHAQFDSLKVLRLQKQIDSLANSSFMEYGFVGVSVKKAQNKSNIAAINAQKSLVPASTLKLITTASAFGVLGENYRFETSVYYDGQIIDGMLQGNLYIKGSGDPTLGSWRFQRNDAQLLNEWSENIKKVGIKGITGKIVADASIFEQHSTPDRWIWGDMGNYYGAAASGLNFHENSFPIVITGGTSIGYDAKIVSIEHQPAGVFNIINQIKTDAAGTGDQVVIYSRPEDNQLVLKGFAPQNERITVKGSITNPPLHLAYHLKKALEGKGISVAQEPTVSYSNNLSANANNTLFTCFSPPLSDIAQLCNFRSINLYAEALLKTSSIKQGFGNSHDNALKALTAFWQGKGLWLVGFDPKDGSGLSPQNGITPNNMTDILAVASQQSWFPSYYQSIPIVGQSGTVHSLGKNTKAAGRVRAKSGSIEGVRSYAGYVYTQSGELLCFSLIANRYNPSLGNITKELEKIIVLMAHL